MTKSITAGFFLVVVCGCGPEFSVRKEPDLLRVDPKEACRLRDVRIDPKYVAQVSDRSTWQIHTTLDNRAALTDGGSQSAATSIREQRKGEWILIDLGCVCHFQNVRQVHPSDGGEPPRYRVDTAGNHGFPYTLQFVGEGHPGASVATFPRAVNARFIRVTVIEDSAKPWSVAELELY